MASGQAVNGVTLDLVAGATITGQFTNLSTNALIASPTAEAIGSAGTLFVTTSDDMGTYEFLGLPADTYSLIVDAPGFAWIFLNDLSITSGAMTCDLTITPESEIAGRPFDDENRLLWKSNRLTSQRIGAAHESYPKATPCKRSGPRST